MPFAQRAGRRIHYQVVGEGPAVLLVPGMGSGARLFGTLPRRFARAGLRCLSFDPIGVAPSDAHSGEYDFGAAAADVDAVLDAAGAPTAALVGTSLGGKVALCAAASAPDRIERLVMLASAALPSARGRRVHRFFEICAEAIPAELFGEAVAPFLFGRTFQARHGTVVDDISRATRPEGATRDLILAQARALQEFDGGRLATAVGCPTLCIGGREDTLTPAEEVRAGAEAIAGARYLEFAQAGHSLLLEDAGVFEAVVEFVTG